MAASRQADVPQARQFFVQGESFLGGPSPGGPLAWIESVPTVYPASSALRRKMNAVEEINVKDISEFPF